MEWEKSESCTKAATCLNYQDGFRQVYFKTELSGMEICACSSIGEIKPISKATKDGKLIVGIEKSLFLLDAEAHQVWQRDFPYVIYDCIFDLNDQIAVVCECAVYLISISTGSKMRTWELDIISYWDFDSDTNELTVFQNYSEDEKEVLFLSG